MGLADKLADIIRPRPRGLFGPSPARLVTEIAVGASSDIAQAGVRAFVHALAGSRADAGPYAITDVQHLDIEVDGGATESDMYDRLRVRCEARGYRAVKLRGFTEAEAEELARAMREVSEVTY